MKFCFTAILFFPFISIAQLKLAEIFTDNMVLQRDRPIQVWGKAIPGNEITVQFNGETVSTTAKRDSSWIITLKKQKAKATGQSMILSSGGKTIALENILIGDVWLALGQSNMEWPMEREKHWNEEKTNLYQPLIRFTNPAPAGRFVYGVSYTDSLNRRLTTDSFYLWKSWQVADSSSVQSMSAVAYYYAKYIVQAVGVPVGIIHLAIGGAPLESFINPEALKKHLRFASKVSGDWLQNKNLPEWTRVRGMQNVGNNPNGYKDDLGLNHAYKPGFAYLSGIQPLINFPIQGIIWYQGESNSLEPDRVTEYRDLFRVMTDDYRKKWKQPLMPVYWAQLSSIDTTNYRSQLWPCFRDEQRLMLADIKYSGMAVTSDIGFKNDVHPTDKKTVGERLARWALYQVYKKPIVPSGPLPLAAKYGDGKIIVEFQWAKSLGTPDGGSVKGFSPDGMSDVAARIEGNKIVIPSANKPQYIFYGWKPFSDGNLINEEGLPASTFRIQVK